ncbi:hypothetical protein PoB_007280400 [Plakobranchus ocellatus]|uniref:Uncharacterized protein n=1 Tax=Plakobranchus ocellatus TaxID=259542 RepID=A0AAV4DQ05_9GAST|nr:hypothetical protein PoB_007280400 [Plakobranchus ocellatus]
MDHERMAVLACDSRCATASAIIIVRVRSMSELLPSLAPTAAPPAEWAGHSAFSRTWWRLNNVEPWAGSIRHGSKHANQSR